MADNIGVPAGTADRSGAKKDCGCGCGGSGGCGDKNAIPRAARRSFLASGLAVASYSVTLPARANSSNCGPITALASPHGSGHHTFTCNGGRTPGFWMNQGQCWPSGLNNPTAICTTTFDFWFAGISPVVTAFNTRETLRAALCPPNGDNFEFQLAGALLNADTFGTSFGYANGKAVAQAVANALAAGLTLDQIHTALANLNFDNGITLPCTGGGKKNQIQICKLSCT